MTAIERIEAICKYLHANIKVFSELCGYERPQAFYDILKGKTKNISANMCDKILSAFPEINRLWLLTGVGEMLVKEDATDEDAAESAEATATQQIHTIPLLNMSALAGPLSCYFEPGASPDDCERIPTTFKNAELALPVNGDSMEPMFEHGSMLFIKRINEAAFIPWGTPLVIDTENGVYIKNVFPDENDSRYIWAESVNPKYPSMHIPKTSIYGMYRVIANVKMWG